MPFDDTIFLKTKVDILSFFNEEQLRRVTPDIERANYSKGQFILLKGEVTSGFYIVKKGKVQVLVKPKGNPPVNQDLAAGDFFGEVSVFQDTSATASVKAMEDDTEILTIPHASFQKLLEMQPLLKQALQDRITARQKK